VTSLRSEAAARQASDEWRVTRCSKGVFSKSNAQRSSRMKLVAAFGLRWQSAAATALLGGQ